MNKKKITRIALTFAMLLGITIVWAAASDGYTNAAATIKTVQDAYDKAQNNVAILHYGTFKTTKRKANDTEITYKSVDTEELVFTSLNKYLNKRAEVIKVVNDSLAKAEEQYQAWLKYNALSEDKKKETTKVKEVAEPSLTDILAKLGKEGRVDAIQLDSTNINTVELFSAIATDLNEKFTKDNVIAFFNAWYEVSDLNTQKPHASTNSGVAKLESTLKACQDAIGYVKGEKWFKSLTDVDIDAQAEALDTLKSDIKDALESADLDALKGLKTTGTQIGKDIKTIRTKVEDAANAELIKIYNDVLALYNSQWAQISGKYEGTGKLDEKQKEYIEQYLSVINTQKEAIDKAKETPSSCADYAKIKAALEDVENKLKDSFDGDLDKMEQAVIDANNALYDNWVKGVDADGKAVDGSYGDAYDYYIQAAKKMDAYKAIAKKYTPYDDEDTTTVKGALADIKNAESDLYGCYQTLEKNRLDVYDQLLKANKEKTERTTSYLADYIKKYTDQGQTIKEAINQCVADAMEAVRGICVELVKKEALEVMTPKVWEAYMGYKNNQPDEEGVSHYNTIVYDGVTSDLMNIKISATKECKTPDSKIANPISDIAISNIVRYDRRNKKYVFTEYTMLYDATKADNNVINADNYQSIIDEINKNVQDSLTKYTTLWNERQDSIDAENAAIDAVEDLLKTVRAYWTEAYGKNEENATNQAALVELRDGIDALEAKYETAQKTNAKVDAKTPWKMHAVRDIKDELLKGLKEYYNKIYPYADPTAAAQTASLKTKAEEAIAALEKSIVEATGALSNVSDENKAALEAAIATARQALADAKEDVANGATKLGAEANDDYQTAATTATNAKTTLDEAVKNLTTPDTIEGDLNGDGVVDGEDAAIAIENRSQADLLKVYKAILKK